ncbi:hypothetical protein HYV98_00010 [Candidatus Azambacteria bacterium]|nr:hypothetical protein [Candidatus Azambacteria bacterium]
MEPFDATQGRPFDATQARRRRKQIIIGIIYLFIFAGLGAGVYFSFFRPSPTCFDRKVNQGETDVDCGGPNCASCERKTWRPLEVDAPKAFPSLSDAVDLVAQVKNPNPRYGAERVSYTFIIKLKTGEERRKSGVAELFPLEERSILEPALRLGSGQAVTDVETVNFVIDRVDWERLDDFARPDIAIVSQTFQEGERPEVQGRILNRSNFAIRELFVTIMLLDEKNSD